MDTSTKPTKLKKAAPPAAEAELFGPSVTITGVDEEAEITPVEIPAPAPVNLEDVAPKQELYRERASDKGQTRLSDHPDLVPKSTSIFSVTGCVAELNAMIGVARANTNAKWSDALPIMQQHLVEIERCLIQKYPPLWDQAHAKIFFLVKGAEELEKLFQRQLNRTDYFPLPGGHPVAAYLHLAATMCWRAERAAVAIIKQDDPNREVVLTYLNRLHHVLQLLARRANRTYGIQDCIAGS